MRKLPVIIFVLLCAMAIGSGYNSYYTTARMIERDMRQALERTVDERGIGAMRQDSIRAWRVMAKDGDATVTITVADATFRRHLHNGALRDRAFLAYTVGRKDGGWTVRVDTHTGCTAGMIWSLSDQRLSLLLSLMATLCLATSLLRNRRGRVRAAAGAHEGDGVEEAAWFGGLRYDGGRQGYVCRDGALVRLTPMQTRLMGMFLATESHRLTKEEICAALWPKKDDASETLYAMIHRLKRELGRHSSLHIRSDRGRAYWLTDE